LGVAKNASDDEIKKAYKKMALKYHPDRNRNKSQVEQEEAAKMFRDINEAQDVLTNPEKRKMYESGAMSYDGDTGTDFSNFGNMGGFNNMGGFGGNGQNFKFTFNGQEMGGMGGMNSSKIF
jgi:DnaJ-class molecular chaperone